MRVFAALLAAVPLSALAQGGPSPSPEADWSLGAGVSAGTVVVVTGSGPPSSVSVGPGAGAIASLERRLANATWMSMNLTASWVSTRFERSTNAAGTTRDDGRSLVAELGVRQGVTGPGSPVEVSLLAMAHGGYAWHKVSDDSPFVSPEQRFTAKLAGLNLGLALERELAPRLSLRVATPVVGIGYSSSRQEAPGQPVLEVHSFSAGIALAPRLELRLAF